MRIFTALALAAGLGGALALVCSAEEAEAEKAPAKVEAAGEVKAEPKGTGKDDPAAAPKAEPGEAPETIVFKQTAKMAPVKFAHKAHADRLKSCAECHEGEKPLFQKKVTGEALKMADMYKGGTCGACHDGKKEVDGKKVFAAKAGCMKCHKK